MLPGLLGIKSKGDVRLFDEDFRDFAKAYVPIHNEMAKRNSNVQPIVPRNPTTDSLFIHIPIGNGDLLSPPISIDITQKSD